MASETRGSARLSPSGGIRSTLPERRRSPVRRGVVGVLAVLVVGGLLGAHGRIELTRIAFGSDGEPSGQEVLLAEGEDEAGDSPTDTAEDDTSAAEDDTFAAQDEPPSERRLPHEEFLANATLMLGHVPSLEELAALIEESAVVDDIAEQHAHLAELDRRAQVTLRGFAQLDVDVSRKGAFADAENYHESIDPKLFVVHWTAAGYDDVDHFIRAITPHRVQFFVDAEARVHDLFDDDRRWPAHALGVNEFSQGVEIESGEFDGERSPLFGITPAQIEQTVYLAVEFLRRNDLPVDHTTIVGHYAADLVFANPHFDPYTGTLRPDGTIRKFDPPEELMEIIVDKAVALDAMLRRAGTAD